MADGIDIRAFEARRKAASAEERAELWNAFWTWQQAGAKQAQPWTIPGSLALSVAGFTVIFWWFGDQSPSLIFLIAPTLVAGVIFFVIGARKEKRWRQSNPFEL